METAWIGGLLLLHQMEETVSSETAYPLCLRKPKKVSIDTDLIFQKAKFVKTFRENFEEKEKDFKELLEKKSKKIEEAIAKGKPEDEIRELVQKRDEELEPKKNGLPEVSLWEINVLAPELAESAFTQKEIV